MRALLPSLFAALDAARLADLSGTTGYGGWGADGSAPFPSWRAVLLDVANDRPTDRVSGWRGRLAASPVGSGPFDQAYERLVALVDSTSGASEERHLIHSDLLHFNVLVEADRVTGVLDWGCGMYGDFLYDLAWLCFWQPWYPAWQRIDFREEALRHYARSSARSSDRSSGRSASTCPTSRRGSAAASSTSGWGARRTRRMPATGPTCRKPPGAPSTS